MAIGDPILLRASRGIKVARPRLIDFGGPLVPPLGGEVQTIQRLGTRHAIDITIPIMRTEPHGRQWAADLSLAKLYGAIVRVRQDGLDIGTPGAPLVDGAGQLGSVLHLKGFTAGYVMRYGQAVSLIIAGRRYFHKAAADTAAAPDGKMALPLFPLLRRSPANNDTAEVAEPKLQGSLSGNEIAWTEMTAPYHDFGTISISEDC